MTSLTAVQNHVDSLMPDRPVGRRGFVVGSLSAGFAASVAPTGGLLAQVIRTDTAGLAVSEAAIPVTGGMLPAYVAMPAGKTKLPTIVVIQEVFGVHEHIKDLCRRLAKQGYLAVAPELYFRQGDPTKYPSVPQLISELVMKVPEPQVLADLDATAAWAARHGGNGAKLGVTGFCWGGRYAWLFAAHNRHVKAAVAWYGVLNKQLTPTSPADVAGRLQAPVLGLYGGQDPGIPVTAINDMKTALAAGNKASKASEFVLYPGSAHGFNADYRPTYDRAAAQDGWQRMLAWFSQHAVV